MKEKCSDCEGKAEQYWVLDKGLVCNDCMKREVKMVLLRSGSR